MAWQIVFVDDEPNVLEGLRRMLRPMRREWTMYFCADAREALNLLDREPVDVVVWTCVCRGSTEPNFFCKSKSSIQTSFALLCPGIRNKILSYERFDLHISTLPSHVMQRN
ncbi:MAG: hypothetical protein WHS46_12070 [Desulfosoma sp.]